MSDVCPDDIAKQSPIEELYTQMMETDERLPLTGTAELTWRCNFTCPHCFCRLPEDARTAPAELTGQQWDRIFGEATDEGLLFMLFTGGEPLLHEDFREIWLSAKRRGMIIELFTNGSLITQELADFFAEWTPKQVSISLYGATEETYAAISGHQGMHARVLHSLDMLVERGIAVEAKSLIMRQNVHEFDALREQCLRYSDVFRWDAELNGTYAEGGGDPMAVRISPKEVIALELRDPVRSNEWQQRLPNDCPAPPSPDSPFRCRVGRSGFHIDPYGGMCPCLLFHGTAPYDLLSGSVREGWREAIPELLTSFRGHAAGPCQSCALAQVCRICPAYALLADGKPGWPLAYYCGIARERARAFDLDADTTHLIEDEAP